MSAVLRIDADLDELRDESAQVKRWITRRIDTSQKINRNAS